MADTRTNTIKLVVAIALLLIAGGILFWYYGMRGSPPRERLTEQEVQEREEEIEEMERIQREVEEDPNVTIGGA